MSKPTTSAVTMLRTATAVVTSTPWSKATRAATWLAPMRRAMSRSVAKAVIDRALRSLIGVIVPCVAAVCRRDTSPRYVGTG